VVLWPKFGAQLRIQNVDSYTSNWNQFVLPKKYMMLMQIKTIAYLTCPVGVCNQCSYI
jgi:hypothetical protein